MSPSVVNPGGVIVGHKPSSTAAQVQPTSFGADATAQFQRSIPHDEDVEQTIGASIPALAPDALAAELERRGGITDMRDAEQGSSSKPMNQGGQNVMHADIIQSQLRPTGYKAPTASNPYVSDEAWRSWLSEQDSVAPYVHKGPITESMMSDSAAAAQAPNQEHQESEPAQSTISPGQHTGHHEVSGAAVADSARTIADSGVTVQPPTYTEAVAMDSGLDPRLQPITMAKPFTARQADQEPVSETPRKLVEQRSPPKLLQATPVRLQEAPAASSPRQDSSQWEEAGDGDKMGFLMKATQSGCFGTRWVTRLFVLKGHSLAYFRNTSNTVPRKTSDVTKSKCSEVGSHRGKKNVFKLQLATGELVLSAYSAEEKKAWMDALIRASGATVIRRDPASAKKEDLRSATPNTKAASSAAEPRHIRAEAAPGPGPAQAPPPYPQESPTIISHAAPVPQTVHSQGPRGQFASSRGSQTPPRRVPGPVTPSPVKNMGPRPRLPAETQGVAEPKPETPTWKLQAQEHKQVSPPPSVNSSSEPRAQRDARHDASGGGGVGAWEAEAARRRPDTLTAQGNAHRDVGSLGPNEGDEEWTWERALEWFEQERERDREPDPALRPFASNDRHDRGPQAARTLRRDLEKSIMAPPTDFLSYPPVRPPPYSARDVNLPPLPPLGQHCAVSPSQISPRPFDPSGPPSRSVSPPPDGISRSSSRGYPSRPPLDPGRRGGAGRSVSPPSHVPGSENFEMELFGSDYRRGSEGSDRLWSRVGGSGRASPSGSAASHRAPSKMDAFRNQTYDGQPRPPRSPARNAVTDKARLFTDPTRAYVPNASLNGSAAASPLTTPRPFPDPMHQHTEQVADWLGVRSPSPTFGAPRAPSPARPPPPPPWQPPPNVRGGGSVPVPLPSPSEGGLLNPRPDASPPSPRPGAPSPSPGAGQGAVASRHGWTTFASARRFGTQGPAVEWAHEARP